MTGVHVLGWGFNCPDAVSSDGSHVWVANAVGNSVTELNASTGAHVQVLSAPSYGFNLPVAISCDGTHVWVVNDPSLAGKFTTLGSSSGGTVTELNASTGALGRC